jgi:uncharacterized membrane protein YfcA
MEIGWYLLAAVGGVFAGFLTTLAGNGSVITLYILTEILGLPPKEANATNRVGVMAMTMAALPGFYKNNSFEWKRDRLIVGTIFIGAIAGIIVASYIDNSVFKAIFKYFFILMLIIVLMDTKSWIRTQSQIRSLKWYISIPLFLLLGFYGGFIQMGTGIFFLAIVVLGMRYSMNDANGLKLASVAVYTVLAISIFAAQGLIDWWIGMSLAIGEAIGAIIAVRFAINHPKAQLWTYRILIAVIVMAIIQKFQPEFWWIWEKISV